MRAVGQWLGLGLGLVLSLSVQARCDDGDVVVQVLGSGGPIADDGRASSGYLLWVEGKARLMVDAGAGTFLRFGEAGASMADLDVVALTHLHADHTASLPGLVNSASFGERTRPMALLGPSGAGEVPGLGRFIDAVFSRSFGAYGYLEGVLDGTDGLFAFQLSELDASQKEARSVYEQDGLSIQATGVEYGGVPALGYVVTIKDLKIAFSGTQNGNNPAFANMIQGADLLVMSHAIAEDASEAETQWHAKPSEIAQMAANAGVKRVVLSHLMKSSLDKLEASVGIIRQHYQGGLAVAKDLMCIPARYQ